MDKAECHQHNTGWKCNIFLNDLTEGDRVYREQNGTYDGTLWDATGEAYWRREAACLYGEVSVFEV